MDKNKKYCITSALPYANGALHLGHLAGAYLPADIYVRYLRGMGCDVAFICGSDEHGAAITMKAKKDGISPQEIIDKYHTLNKGTFEKLGISFDFYHRTSAELHHKTSQEFFLKLIEKGGELEERTSEQYFDEQYQQFLADRFIVGECPKCANPEAYGDQCERCGSTLSPTELINPKSVLSGSTPVLKETSHWYFRLDKHGDWLREWIENGTIDGQPHHDPKAWKNHVVGQCLSWLNDGEGLQPRSITRDLDWGIPVPMPGAEGKVLYVWFDAPIGYISSTKQWAAENGKNWEDYWKGGPDKLQLVHFIGKDNIVFHCIVFPSMLKAHGDYALPVNVPANQFLNFEGRKFSKSKGWGIEQHEYLEEFANFPNKEDALRWALIRNLPENRDADFKWDEFVDFYDKDLADKLGNFINRVIVLTHNYFNGEVPNQQYLETGQNYGLHGHYVTLRWHLTNPELNSIADTDDFEVILPFVEAIKRFKFKMAASKLVDIVSFGNEYLQEKAPWKVWKETPNSQLVKESIFISLQIVTLLSIICEPFIPFTSLKIRKLLNLPKVKYGDLDELLAKLENGEALLPAGHKVNAPEILFAKINDRNDKSRLEIIERQKAKLEAILAKEAATMTEQPSLIPNPSSLMPLKAEIQYDDFAKMDIRTATIIAAERIPKADKLLKLSVDLGFEQRTVVSGIAEHFTPEEVIGQRVLLLANLAPRKLRGVDSQGMILMAENAEGKLSFVQAGEAFGPGLGVK
jgi:methionyl-tRNA synthetase